MQAKMWIEVVRSPFNSYSLDLCLSIEDDSFKQSYVYYNNSAAMARLL
jgi:hypothetical protein